MCTSDIVVESYQWYQTILHERHPSVQSKNTFCTVQVLVRPNCQLYGLARCLHLVYSNNNALIGTISGGCISEVNTIGR